MDNPRKVKRDTLSKAIELMSKNEQKTAISNKITDALLFKNNTFIKNNPKFTRNFIFEKVYNLLTDSLISNFDYKKFFSFVDEQIFKKELILKYDNILQKSEEIDYKSLDHNFDNHKLDKNLIKKEEREDNILTIRNDKLNEYLARQKDKWAASIKEDTFKFLEEQKKRKKDNIIDRKAINDILSKQIEDKRKSKDEKNKQDLEYLNYIKEEQNKYNLEQEKLRIKSLKKLNDFQNARDRFVMVQNQLKEEANLKNKLIDEVLLKQASVDSLKELEKLNKKKQEEQNLFIYQIKDLDVKSDNLKSKKEKERKNGLNELSEFSKIIDKQDQERESYHKKISDKSIVLEKRQKLFPNVKELTDYKDKLVNNRYILESKEIDLK